MTAANQCPNLSETRSKAQWVLEGGHRYWPGNSSVLLSALRLPDASWNASRQCVLVALPEWASDLGVGHPPALLVDSAAIAAGAGPAFERCNWLAAAFLFLSGAQEMDQGASSYASLNRGFDLRVLDRAWVNRMLLLLRRMAARQSGIAEIQLFGALPTPAFDLTHDVDAIRKTTAIRMKQSAFLLFNAARAGIGGEWDRANEKVRHAARFVISTPRYRTLSSIRAIESEFGLRSTLHFYAGPHGLSRASPRRMLLDPAYDIADDELRTELVSLLEGGWSIGLHGSFDSWRNADVLRREKATLERACGGAVTRCRQHWLRFSWAKTWQAQQEAGFTLDATLGFNDRPGFRNASALRFKPWSAAKNSVLKIESLPMVFMDSHFYDYAILDAEQRRLAMRYWIDEIRAVHGEASMNWHTHTLAEDYGWSEGYMDLLRQLC
jgi:hypothetical protein